MVPLVKVRAVEPSWALWLALEDPLVSADEFAALARQIYGDDDDAGE